MRLRAPHLNVLAIAPAAAMLAAIPGPTVRAATGPAPPSPIVVTIDAGHGGLPSRTNPTQPFDPGAIGPNGLLEKDVALDVSKRLAVLLRDDLVQPVLTRSSDVYVTIPAREQTSIAAHASLFVSIHCNSFADPSVGGTVVLYPGPASQRFAQVLSDSLGSQLAPDGVGDDGIQLRDNWWIHNPVPTSTAEIAYISNAREAALMATGAFRQEVAAALHNGIEAYDPSIIARRNAIIAWDRAHPTAAASGTRTGAHLPAGGGIPFGTVLTWVLGIAAVAAVVRWREPVARVLVLVVAVLVRMSGGALAARRALVRRRRRRRRGRGAGAPAHTWAVRPSVYDDLPL